MALSGAAVMTPYERRRQDDHAVEVNDRWFATTPTPATEAHLPTIDGDGSEVATWLRWVHTPAIDAGVAGWVVLSSPTPNDTWQSLSFNLAELDNAGRAAANGSDAGRNVYYRLALLGGPVERWRRGRGDEARWLTHLAADVDVAGPGHASDNLPTLPEALALIDTTLPPSAIVASGGGVYAVWRFAEVVTLTNDDDRRRVRDLGNRLDAALAAHGFHVDGLVGDLARVIRPPGVANRKPKRDVRPVTVLRGWVDGAGDVTLTQLDDVLPPLPAKPTRTPPKRTTGAAGSATSVVDTFNARHTIAAVLAADGRGWRYVRTSGHRDLWVDAASTSTHTLSHDTTTNRVSIMSSRLASELGVEALRTTLDPYGLACRLAGRDPSDTGRTT